MFLLISWYSFQSLASWISLDFQILMFLSLWQNQRIMKTREVMRLRIRIRMMAQGAQVKRDQPLLGPQMLRAMQMDIIRVEQVLVAMERQFQYFQMKGCLMATMMRPAMTITTLMIPEAKDMLAAVSRAPTTKRWNIGRRQYIPENAFQLKLSLYSPSQVLSFLINIHSKNPKIPDKTISQITLKQNWMLDMSENRNTVIKDELQLQITKRKAERYHSPRASFQALPITILYLVDFLWIRQRKEEMMGGRMRKMSIMLRLDMAEGVQPTEYILFGVFCWVVSRRVLIPLAIQSLFREKIRGSLWFTMNNPKQAICTTPIISDATIFAEISPTKYTRRASAATMVTTVSNCEFVSQSY